MFAGLVCGAEAAQSARSPIAFPQSGSDQTRGSLPDGAADDIENQVDATDVLQGVVLKVDELRSARGTG
jgi:hypothetical protein